MTLGACSYWTSPRNTEAQVFNLGLLPFTGTLSCRALERREAEAKGAKGAKGAKASEWTERAC